MKRAAVLSIIAVLTLAVASAGDVQHVSAHHPCGSPIFGDVSGNGVIDPIDADIIKRLVKGDFLHVVCGPADVDCDWDVDMRDASAMKKAIKGAKYKQNEPCPDIGSLRTSP